MARFWELKQPQVYNLWAWKTRIQTPIRHFPSQVVSPFGCYDTTVCVLLTSRNRRIVLDFVLSFLHLDLLNVCLFCWISLESFIVSLFLLIALCNDLPSRFCFSSWFCALIFELPKHRECGLYCSSHCRVILLMWKYEWVLPLFNSVALGCFYDTIWSYIKSTTGQPLGHSVFLFPLPGPLVSIDPLWFRGC